MFVVCDCGLWLLGLWFEVLVFHVDCLFAVIGCCVCGVLGVDVG